MCKYSLFYLCKLQVAVCGHCASLWCARGIASQLMMCMWNCRQALKFWEHAHQSTVSSYKHVAVYGVWIVVMKEWTMCVNWGVLNASRL